MPLDPSYSLDDGDPRTMCDCSAARIRHTRPRARVGHVNASPFDYPATEVGKSGNVTVYYDPGLGAKAKTLAEGLLKAVDSAYRECAAWFGMPGHPVNLLIVPLGGYNDGSGGAYHYGCTFTSGGDLYVDATFDAPQPVPMALGLFVAELSECFQGAQGKGWQCGGSNGEALSRVHAEQVSGGPDGALKDFTTAPVWVQTGLQDWVTQTEGTDQDDKATGCGVLYIYWMMSQGHTLASITAAGGKTLADNYHALTGKTTALADLKAAVKTLPPNFDTDNPWPATPQPQPQPVPTPAPTPTPSPTKGTITIHLDADTVSLPAGWKVG